MSWWKTAKPGDKVTRVEGSPWVDAVTNEVRKDQHLMPQFGETFEIKAIKANPLQDAGVELFFGHIIGGRQEWFSAAAFRPVNTKSNETGTALGLTKRQSDALVCIRSFVKEHGYAPSYGDIAEALGLASKSGVHRLVTSLEERGLITRLPNKARSIVVKVAA